MTTGFPRVTKRARGYSVEQVDAFLQEARRSYESPPEQGLTAAGIRLTAFDLKRGGYETGPVDAALERLEDVFAARERELARQRLGDEEALAEARRAAQEIVARLSRPEGKRFARTSILSFGYHRSDVDRFARRLIRYFQEGRPLGVDEVRRVVFRPQRRGYREPQVDLLLDAVVDVMLAVG